METIAPNPTCLTAGDKRPARVDQNLASRLDESARYGCGRVSLGEGCSRSWRVRYQRTGEQFDAERSVV